MKIRRIALLIPLFTLLTPLSASVPVVPTLRDANGCRFLQLGDFGTGPARWIGACNHGAADGPGVLRVGPANDVRLFAGTMRAGRALAGFVITQHFYASGPTLHFDQGEWDNEWEAWPTIDDNEAQQACKIAARGARAAANRLAKEGNTASARFYRRWANGFRNCKAPTGS
jgi:hypothetical protein